MWAMSLSVRDCCGRKNGEGGLRKKLTFGLYFTRASIGPLICVNLSSLVLPFPCYPGERDLGWSGRKETQWYKLDVPCRKCQRHVTHRSGITCANFGHARGRFPPCQSAWCAECFIAHPLDTFETAVPRDFNGASLAEVEDEIRFRRARPGDHICCSFQCPNCQSQNIRGIDLRPGDVEDEAFEFACVRATLDAFWAHSTRTVANHRSQVKFMLKYAAMLGLPTPLPRLGPFPLGHHLGMREAIMLIMRSLEPGTGRDGKVKYGTARKVRSTITVLWDASPESGSDIALSSSSKGGRFVATCNPAEGRWYQHFATGCAARMGDVVKQDRAFTIGVLHKLLESYEKEYQDYGLSMSDTSMQAVMFLLLTSLGGMRGFEAVWTDLAALRYDVAYCEDMDDYSAVSWPIVGRFKAHHGMAGCYMIPIAGTTNSGIEFFRWTQRFIIHLARRGLENGWAFQRKDGTRALAGDFRKDIFSRLEVIQATTTLIDPDVDVWDEYGVQRSGRRFFTTHFTNMGVEPHLIEIQARWQSDRANGERSVQRTMLHTYSEVRNMKETLIKPSLHC